MSVNSIQSNFWVFQANPKFYRIIDALKAMDNAKWNWMVNQHKKKLQIGDKVIIWVCGDQAGVYALGTVTSEVKKFKDDNDAFYIDDSKSTERDRVNIRIDINLTTSGKPILKKEFLESPKLQDMPQGIPATNLIATKTHYDNILSIITARK
jgi:hypothetical protein